MCTQSIERHKDPRGYNYVVRFPSPIFLEGKDRKQETVWFNTSAGEDPSEAAQAAWSYFKEVCEAYARRSMSPELCGLPGSFGPLRPKEGDKYFHGKEGDPAVEADQARTFWVIKQPFLDGTGKRTYEVYGWDPFIMTATPADRFCGCLLYTSPSPRD